MTSPQAAWQIVKFLSIHPRIRIAVVSVGGCIFFHQVIYAMWSRWLVRKKVAARRLEATWRKKTARQACGEAQEIDLSNQTAESLVKAIVNDNFTAEEVLNAFTKKALDVDEDINAVTEPIVEAWDQVKILDALDEKSGLLHGVPVSIKESIQIGGYDATGGMAKFVNKIAVNDAVIVKVLKNQGAVPFMRTNLPQTMMSYCSSNPIYGETLNPFDKTRTPGGSSSGEGALIGAGGSIIGIGTDVGGSIRVPASFCGIFSLKTTNRRLSVMGTLKTNPGRQSIQGSIGLTARDFESLVLLSKATMSKDMWTMDPTLPQLPFNQQEFNKTEGLRIGYYTYDGNVQCQPPVIRAVMEAKEALERKGHTLVPIDYLTTFKTPFDSGNFYVRLMAADSGQIVKKLLAYDKLEIGVSRYLKIFFLPRWLLRILSLLISQIDPFLGKMIKGFYGFKSIYEYFVHVAAFVRWQEYFMESWMDNQFDAIICPVFPSPAPLLKHTPSLTTAALYCQLYNSLDYPSGCIPITKVTKEDVAQTLDPDIHQPDNLIESLLLKNAPGMEGMPVGVQCVALPFKEEMCLRVMRDIDGELRN